MSQKLPIAAGKLERGQELQFKVCRTGARWLTRIFAVRVKDFLKVPTDIMTVDMLSVRLPGQACKVSDMRSFCVIEWSDAIRVMNHAGEPVLHLNYVSLYNADLFLALLEKLILRKSTPAVA